MSVCQRWALIVGAVLTLASATKPARSQSDLRERAVTAMRRAAEFYSTEVAVHGGYVYHYTLDLSQRWGEGLASDSQIWVQPPATPTVGMALLRAYEATGDHFYLNAVVAAAEALVYGQLQSGGWTNLIDFDPTSKRTARYRNGRGQGKNHSSLDDGQTQSALQLLIRVDQALNFERETIHDAAQFGLDALLQAQFPNGGFPQVWTGPVRSQPIVPASYPDYPWRTQGRIKNYWDMYTLNDNVPGYVTDALIDAHRVYGHDKYLDAIARLGDFLILAQMPDPQPGWAQQYNYAMQPIWARRFEPPGVCGEETQETIQALVKIAHATGDHRFLEPISRAIEWLRRSALPDGQIARYYELRTNRPLFMRRVGHEYRLSYDDSNLPSHYGWKTASRVSQLQAVVADIRRGKSPVAQKSLEQLGQEAEQAVSSLDSRGRWVSAFTGERLVGQAKMPQGSEYLSSQVFSQRLSAISDWLVARQR